MFAYANQKEKDDFGGTQYIIAVDELYGGGRGARLTDVALKMGVTKVSVYKMFERLECRGLMERNALNRIFLTDSGRANSPSTCSVSTISAKR